MEIDEADYVVIGSGSAGAIIASRLSEDPDCSVLLMEAGPRDRSPLLHVPAAARHAFNARRYNWSYRSEPEPGLSGRRLAQPRGKVLGGSSSINGLVYLRGHALDYESWAECGATGWSYPEVLPYFLRLERFVGPTTEYRGGSGPVKVSTADDLNPISRAFMEACAQAGYEFTDDVNGYRQEGFGRFPMNAAHGYRWSTARAYLHPAAQRANLAVRTGCVAERILFEGRRAVAVACRHNRRRCRVRARREIVLSAGAFNSPKLLMLSGVGPPDHLRAHDIEVRQELPGVGRNLQDHQISSVQMACKRPVSLAGRLSLPSRTMATLRWVLRRDGLLASNHFECGAFIRSAAGIRFPDIQLYCFPIAVAEGSKDFLRDHGFQIQVSPQRSPSRGRVELASGDPDAAPMIRFNYLVSEQDYISFRAGFRLAREVLRQEAMRPYRGEELSPGPATSSDEALDRFVRDNVQSSYHPSGTCRMGRDPLAVVDPQCRVHGLSGLRVADASVMPAVPSCNINCPTMMIGEKAADMIAGCDPLPPLNLPWYVDPEWRKRQRPRPPGTT